MDVSNNRWGAGTTSTIRRLDPDSAAESPTVRNIVIFMHYLSFVAGFFVMWVFMKKFRTLETCIYSPFLVLIGIAWLQIGGGINIGGYYYSEDWNILTFRSPFDLVNGTFYFFHFGGNYLIALGLRKFDLPLFRSLFVPKFSEKLAILLDMFMVIGLPATPVLYATVETDLALFYILMFGIYACISKFCVLSRRLLSI